MHDGECGVLKEKQAACENTAMRGGESTVAMRRPRGRMRRVVPVSRQDG